MGPMNTRTIKIPDGVLVVRYGFDVDFAQRHNQEPHFSISAGLYDRPTRIPGDASIKHEGKRYWLGSCGCLHDVIAEHAPDLAPLIRWHLCGPASGPMHYAANAAYWLELHYGVSEFKRRSYDPEPLGAFERTVIFGAVEGDELPPLEELTAAEQHSAREAGVKPVQVLRAALKRDTADWCAARLPALLGTMHADCDAAGVEVPS